MSARGRSSKRSARSTRFVPLVHPSSAEGADPPIKRTTVRITNVYATSWRISPDLARGELGDYLRLWRLERNYRLAAEQLPRVLTREELDPRTLRMKRWQDISALAGARVWLFSLPSGRVVAAFSIDVASRIGDVVDLLEDCYFCDIHVDGTVISEAIHRLVASFDGQMPYGEGLLPERHQLVFGDPPDPVNCEDMIQRLIYRAKLPYRRQYSVIRYPHELNRRPGWIAAVGPYVSVICGHADFIQNTIFLSAVQAVAAATELREIRHSAYQDVKTFRSPDRGVISTQDRRRALERMADKLKELQVELSFSVEAPADLGLLVPSLRVESYHNSLFDSMGLSEKSETVSKMLERLEKAIDAELTSIESAERRADEERRLRWGVAIGYLSTIAVPAGIILAFFGMNAHEVDPDRSMFDQRYLPLYLIVLAVMSVGAIIAFVLYIQQKTRNRRLRKTDEP